MTDQVTVNRSPSPPERIKLPAEDPDTAAARKELDNTAISEESHLAMSDRQASSAETHSFDGKTKLSVATPDREAGDMRDQLSSPKKKRAHDEVDEAKDSSHDPNRDISPIGANGRSDRSEPEKKRHRDISNEKKPEESSKASDGTAEAKSDAKGEAVGAKKKSETAASAFKSSGLSGFASQASPFMAVASKPLTSFASATGSASPFGAAALKSDVSTPSAFGGSSLANGTSPFAQIGGPTKPFGGSAFGGTFGSGIGGLGGSKLTSFGKPGDTLTSSKPAKPFGAPESDVESGDDSGDDDDENDVEAGKPEKEVKEKDSEDKKKPKLQKLAVDDGEAAEATILQVRAKIFHLDKSTTPAAWKERGAGNLKINVPESSIDFDENGVPIPGSFDASVLEGDQSKLVRLIMRQDATHRIILNTAIIPAMIFQEKTTNKTICVLFTAIEGAGDPVSIQVKMNPANAKSFVNEVTKIQRELQSS